MRAPFRSATLVGAILAVAVAAILWAGSPANADNNVGTFAGAERSAVLELYAAESAVARARADAAASHRRLDGLKQRERELHRNARIVRDSYAVTQARIASMLRELYERDQRVDVLAIAFGAESLDAALEGFDSLARAAELQRQLAAEARLRGDQLRRALTRLGTSRHRLSSAAEAADAATRRLEGAASAKADSLESIRREHNLNSAQVAKVASQAAAAQSTNAQLQADARDTETEAAVSANVASPAPPPPAPNGTRQLVVDAVAYHLPGRTASGLPVGIGVIAVDPTVIPLGTRVYVPGYGAAVAADTGTAIKGLIIDLWMPTTAQARAWGRRTVTITIYG